MLISHQNRVIRLTTVLYKSEVLGMKDNRSKSAIYLRIGNKLLPLHDFRACIIIYSPSFINWRVLRVGILPLRPGVRGVSMSKIEG